MEYGAFTDTGMIRKVNEDYYYVPENADADFDLIIVADGMGGHNAGELASSFAVKSILDYLRKHFEHIDSQEVLQDIIIESIQHANSEVYDFSRSNDKLEGMGTTLTMAIFYEGFAHIGHVGDSRGYLIRDNCVCQLTRDHSLVQELLDNGSITADEMANHPQKNVITRALGTEQYIKIDYHKVALEENDIILLCTDGLIQHVNIEESIKKLPLNLPLNEIAELLGQEALAKGGADNLTIVLARKSDCREKR